MLLPIAWPGRTALGLFVMMEVGQYVLQVTKFQRGKPRTDWFLKVLISVLFFKSGGSFGSLLLLV